MRICLISPPTITEFSPEVAESDSVRLIAEHAPMGILSLAAVLEQIGLQPRILDLNRLYYEYIRSPGSLDEATSFCSFVVQHLNRLSFDVFGFGTICSSYPLTIRIAREVKAVHPESRIVLGGPQASVVDVSTLSTFGFIDYIVRGEAEETLPRLLESLDGGSSCASIQGITFRSGESVVRNQNAPVIQDLDSLPLPAFHLYDHIASCTYVPLEHGRGCPFACSFCSTNDFFRRRFRLKSPECVIGQMKLIETTYSVNQFDLIHDMFTVDRSRVVEFCEALRDSAESFYWTCSARTDCIDDELIALMARSGCRGVFFGVDSGSDRIQNDINKHLDLSEALSRVKCTSKHKMSTSVSLIVGFPEETKDDLRATVNFLAESLRFSNAEPQFHLLAPLAETPLTTRYADKLIFDGMFSDISYQGWHQDRADLELIRSHMTIFPNFYAVPTKWLDRRYLAELKEFLLRGALIFRWLLVCLYQDSADLLKVFDLWKEWCLKHEPNGASKTVKTREYYGSKEFADDFLAFVSLHYLPKMARTPSAVSTMLECEYVFQNLIANSEVPLARRPSTSFPLNSIARLNSGVRVKRVEADYKKLLKCLKSKGDLRSVPTCPTWLAIRKSGKQLRVFQMSELSSRLLQMCDGTLTVREILGSFSRHENEIEGVAADTAGLFGLEILRKQGLIALSS